MNWANAIAILVGSLAISLSILFIGRYEISGYGEGTRFTSSTAVYRLDRWTGRIDVCAPVFKQTLPRVNSHYEVVCSNDIPQG